MVTFWIILKRINKFLVIFVFFHIIWIYCYQLWWVKIPACNEFFVISGKIYMAIALSIVAGYVIYLITSEYPKIKERIGFIPTLDYYIIKISNTKHDILTMMNYPESSWLDMDDYTREQLHADFKERISERMESEISETGKSRKDVFEETMMEFRHVLNKLNMKSTEHFKYFHKYLSLEIIEILKRIEIHTNKIFNSTRGIIAYGKAIGLGDVVENDHGLIALELADIYIDFSNLIEQVTKEVKKYK